MADPTAELIDRLLASGKVSKETREELGEFRNDLAAGRLTGDDRRYVESLARRLLGVGAAANDDAVVGESEDVADEDGSFWEAGEDPEIEALRQRAEAAEARVAELEAELADLRQRLPPA